ncbi:MAG: hypothetical protein MRJ92_02840 [Nitrospira sp.]|nr:hypothetical protein [Nitrospira sp.]
MVVQVSVRGVCTAVRMVVLMVVVVRVQVIMSQVFVHRVAMGMVFL